MTLRLLSPVFTKELRQLANSRRPYILRAVFLGILGTVLVTFIVRSGGVGVLGEAGRARELFGVLTLTMTSMLWALMPLLTCGAVVGERQANTMGLLKLTRLRDWQIVQDKALARVVLVLHLCLLSLPLFYAVYLFGGIGAEEVAELALRLVDVAVLGAGAGLYASATAATQAGAALRAYGVCFLCLFPKMMTGVLVFGVLSRVGFSGPILYHALAVVVSLGFYIILVRKATWRLQAGATRAAFGLPAAWNDRNPVLNGPGWGRWFTARRPVGNPLLWRQVRVSGGSHRAAFGAACVGLVILLAVCLVKAIFAGKGEWWRASESVAVVGWLTVPGLAIASLGAVVLGTGSVAGEREGQAWGMILTTPVPGPMLGRGLLLGTGAPVFFLAVLALLSQSGALIIDMKRLPEVAVLAVWVLLFAAFMLGVGILLALRASSPMAALGWGLLIYVAIVVLPLPVAFVVGSVIGQDAGRTVLSTLWLGRPLGDLLFADGRASSALPQVAVYAVGALLIWGLLIFRFDRLVGRQPGKGKR